VLPFENLSDDADQEHFADGLTEEILNVLATVDNLRLVSRTSSFSYKDRSTTIPEVAQQLGVQHILEGSVRRSGDRIRITAQLIDADNDAHLWSQTYDRTLSVENIFEVQEEVSEAVAQVLHASLRTTDERTLRVTPPRSIGAFDDYLAGMEYVRRLELGQQDGRDELEFERAVAVFESSINADPNWAPSHAGLGRIHHFWIHLDRDRQFQLSLTHITEAIRLDENYGPAWASLGYLEMLSDNYDESLAAYNRARDLGAGNNWGRAILFRQFAQYDQSVEEYRLARQWDPLSRPVRGQMLGALYCAGQNDEFLEATLELIEDVPDNLDLKGFLAYARVKNGEVEEGLVLANEVARAEGSDASVLDVLALAGEEERVMRQLDSDRVLDFWGPQAAAAAIIGHTDTALDILESAEQRMRTSREDIRCSPEIRQLEDEPRFQALLQRLDLSER
ncbi:MAG: hypothetical protein ACR2QR_05570, partial [Woeseiaceae bacterium]